MEEIPYRNTKLLVKTIPKGTVLFRLVTKKNNDEIRGIPNSDGTRCISPNHNVFFYPNPFLAKEALEMWSSKSNYMSVYILEHPVKVLWLLLPSKYSRVTKNTKRNFITRCTNIKPGCIPYKGKGMHAKFNPCVSETMIRKYPDVTGMITLSIGDAPRIRSFLKKTSKQVLQYQHTAKDSNYQLESIPELILHPLRKRPQKDLIVNVDDELDNAYSFYRSFSAKDTDTLIKFMKTLEYDSSTYFFKVKKHKNSSQLPV